jgi:large subunit ribosomal protein L13
MKSYMASTADATHGWYVVDASGVSLGRLATELAMRLSGKHKAVFTPHADTGDFLVVVNARKVRVTGQKRAQKRYHRHTGYIGGLKTVTFEEQLASHPERIIEEAVRGMLPKTPLGRGMIQKLKIYPDETHPHQAQCPKPLMIRDPHAVPDPVS